MSTAAAPQTFADLYTLLMNKLRYDTTQTTSVNQAKGAICTALYDMHIGFGEKFPWCHRDAQLLTQPQYAAGTLDATQGSASIAGTSTAWNTNNAFGVANVRAGGKMVIGGGLEIYEIGSVSSDTAAALTSKFVSDDTTGASFTYFEDEYALVSDFMRPLDLQSFSQAMGIDLIGRREFRLRYPRNNTPGKPRVATIFDKAFSGDATPVRHVAFHQPPDQAYIIPYSYVTSNLAVSSAGAAQANLSADTDEPIVPLRYRHVIVLHALQGHYRDKKDDPRSQEVKAEYTDLMLRIVGDGEIGASRPQMRPRVASYGSHARRPWRGGATRRYTAGVAFDQVRD